MSERKKSEKQPTVVVVAPHAVCETYISENVPQDRQERLKAALEKVRSELAKTPESVSKAEAKFGLPLAVELYEAGNSLAAIHAFFENEGLAVSGKALFVKAIGDLLCLPVASDLGLSAEKRQALEKKRSDAQASATKKQEPASKEKEVINATAPLNEAILRLKGELENVRGELANANAAKAELEEMLRQANEDLATSRNENEEKDGELAMLNETLKLMDDEQNNKAPAKQIIQLDDVLRRSQQKPPQHGSQVDSAFIESK